MKPKDLKRPHTLVALVKYVIVRIVVVGRVLCDFLLFPIGYDVEFFFLKFYSNLLCTHTIQE
jgi:hypothetical protein